MVAHIQGRYSEKVFREEQRWKVFMEGINKKAEMEASLSFVKKRERAPKKKSVQYTSVYVESQY